MSWDLWMPLRMGHPLQPVSSLSGNVAARVNRGQVMVALFGLHAVSAGPWKWGTVIGLTWANHQWLGERFESAQVFLFQPQGPRSWTDSKWSLNGAWSPAWLSDGGKTEMNEEKQVRNLSRISKKQSYNSHAIEFILFSLFIEMSFACCSGSPRTPGLKWSSCFSFPSS